MYIAAVCILSVLYFWILYNIPILAVGVRHLQRSCQQKMKASPLSGDRLPTVSIIAPVKDEEKVIDRLMRALLRLNYPPGKMEIVIVDGSRDKTVEMCADYARRYPDQVKLVSQPMSNGKPSALNCGLKHVSGEIVAVFDADNVPEPDVLMRAVEYFEDGVIAAVQGRTCSVNADENMLTKLISYEEDVRFEAHMRGKDVLRLFVPLTGSCYFIRRCVLEKVGGWDDECLSEDMEMAVRLTERGYEIKYAPYVRSWQENPASLVQLFGQRTRWFRGCMEVGLKYGRLVRKLDRRCIDAEVALAGPYMFVPCLLGYFMAMWTLLNQIQLDPFSAFMAQGTALLTTVTLFVIGVALVSLTKPRKVANLLWLPFIYAYWSVQNLIALYALIQIVLKRPRNWTKTKKSGTVTNYLRARGCCEGHRKQLKIKESG